MINWNKHKNIKKLEMNFDFLSDLWIVNDNLSIKMIEDLVVEDAYGFDYKILKLQWMESIHN